MFEFGSEALQNMSGPDPFARLIDVAGNSRFVTASHYPCKTAIEISRDIELIADDYISFFVDVSPFAILIAFNTSKTFKEMVCSMKLWVDDQISENEFVRVLTYLTNS